MATWTAGPRRLATVLATVLAAVIAGLLASAAAAAFANPIPVGPAGPNHRDISGIPISRLPPSHRFRRLLSTWSPAAAWQGWQVAPIAAGTALAAAAAAVLADRKLAGRRGPTATTA